MSLIDALITVPDIIVNEFKEYFRKLLNKVPVNDSNAQKTRAYTVDQEVLAPSLNETKATIYILKNNKVKIGLTQSFEN